MSLPTTVLPAPATGLRGLGRTGLLARRRWRRRARARLARHDVLVARLGELHAIEVLLADAGRIVESGWVQHGWFAYQDDTGRRRVASAYDLHRMGNRPVVGACLVGAVVHAGGGPRAVRSQVIKRALDLTWHTLREDPQRRVRWSPSPAERAVEVRDLTGWNDAPGRSAGQVGALLDATRAATRTETRHIRQEQRALSL